MNTGAMILMIVVDVLAADAYRLESWSCQDLAQAYRIAAARMTEYRHDRDYRGDRMPFVIIIADSVHPYSIDRS